MKAQYIYDSKEYIELKEKLYEAEKDADQCRGALKSYQAATHQANEETRKANREREEALGVIIKIVNKSY